MKYRILIVLVLTIALGVSLLLSNKPSTTSEPPSEASPTQDAFRNFKIPN